MTSLARQHAMSVAPTPPMMAINSVNVKVGTQETKAKNVYSNVLIVQQQREYT